MTNRMLINATQAEEVRVAIVNGSVLDNLDTEILGKEQQKANIYKGKITRIEPSLEAVFVDYGGERHGFLPFREISKLYHKVEAEEQENAQPETTTNEAGETVASEPVQKPRKTLRDKFFEGQELIIQVEKEARGNKGAALTTFISLAGCYLVLMPLNPTAGGISRRIEHEERAELREILHQLNIPEGMGVIVRTAGVGRDIKDLQWDLDFLVQQWQAIANASKERPSPFLIYQESNVVVRAIRDHLRPEINEILVDSPKVFEDVNTYVRMMRPDYITRVKLYNDSIPLFSRFQIESQIENAMQREVRLPSGGSVVIDHTEALISIDINSAKATKGGDIEETAFQTNLEAAECIARQLRLRDIGGLIVIDFIDMGISRNQRAVEQKLKEALEVDRARVQIGKISRFGLLEMSRQRLRPSLSAARDIVCPRCLGQGTIRGVDVLAINMIRLIEEEAIKDGTAQVIVEVPTEVATYLINEKRQAVLDIERKHHIRVILVPSQHLETPNFVIARNKKDDSSSNSEQPASYTLASKPEIPKNVYNSPSNLPRQPAAVVSNINNNMAPQKQGIFKRIITSILGNNEQAPVAETVKPAHTHNRSNNNRYRNHSGGNRSDRNDRGDRSDRGDRTERTDRNEQRAERGERGENTGNNQRNRNRSQNPNRNRSPRPQHARNANNPNNPNYNNAATTTPQATEERAEVQQLPVTRPEVESTNNVEAPAVAQNFESQSVSVNENDQENTDASTPNADNKNPNQQNRRRKQNRRRNHYRKGQGNRVNREAESPSETKVDE